RFLRPCRSSHAVPLFRLISLVRPASVHAARCHCPLRCCNTPAHTHVPPADERSMTSPFPLLARDTPRTTSRAYGDESGTRGTRSVTVSRCCAPRTRIPSPRPKKRPRSRSRRVQPGDGIGTGELSTRRSLPTGLAQRGHGVELTQQVELPDLVQWFFDRAHSLATGFGPLRGLEFVQHATCAVTDGRVRRDSVTSYLFGPLHRRRVEVVQPIECTFEATHHHLQQLARRLRGAL